jgi:ParB/RepB/Spo0J family partition protein
VAPHPANARDDWDNQDLEALARSLQENDLLQPILVRRHQAAGASQPYQLIFGERRLRAAKLAGWRSIPARVIAASDAKTLLLMGIENQHRRDLNPMQLARHLVWLNKPLEAGGAGMTWEAISAEYGHKYSWAANLVRLVKLPADFQALVAAGELDPTAARSLVPYVDQPEVLEAIRRDMRANPDDWRRRDDIDNNARHLARQVNEGAAPPAEDLDAGLEQGEHVGGPPAARPCAGSPIAGPSSPAAAAATSPAPMPQAAPGPTLRQAEAHALLAPYAANAADLKLLRSVANELLVNLRRAAE